MQNHPRTVTSRDGTRIAFRESGTGPPLLLVHGATADHSTTWRFVLPLLEQRFSVFAMDRRGRGGSSDAREYSLEREAEDVAAVLEVIGGQVNVVCHSYGGLCALEAALLTSAMRRLVLYEAIPLDGATLYRPEAVERLERLLAAGDVEGMLVSLYLDLVEMPPAELELLRAQEDAWQARLANAPTVPRELKEETSYVFRPDRFTRMNTPTMLLVGGDSPAREHHNAENVAAALPAARVVVLAGQQHAATYTAPELFADTVSAFLAAELAPH